MKQTKKLPALCPRCLSRYTMHDDVYGHACQAAPAPARRLNHRERVLVRACAVLGVLAGLTMGCAVRSVSPAAEPETVGALSASYHSIAVAPVHHDEPPVMGQLAGSADDDDAGEVASTTTRAVDAGGASDAAAPDVEKKVAHGF